jgi:hypothetical protein
MPLTPNATRTPDTAPGRRGTARPSSISSGPWRRDLSSLTAIERRLARYALQLCQGAPELLEERAERELAGALWPLLLPLLDPQALARWLASGRPRMEEEDETPWSEDPPQEPPHLRRRLIQALRPCPASVLTSLVAADDDRPLNPVTRLLGDSLDLDAPSLRVLDYLDLYLLDERLRQVVRACGRTSPRVNRARLAAALGIGEHPLKALLSRQAPLHALGLVQVETDNSDLEDFLRPSDLLREVFDAAPTSVDELLGLISEPAPPAAWTLADFPHLASAGADLGATLAAAARTGAAGVNALFYGEPGTGKTELARALAAVQGLRAFQVRSADDDGDGLSRQGRLAAYLLAQRLLSRRRDTLLIFDEVEDIFQSSDIFLALFSRRGPGQQKGWINRTLEVNNRFSDYPYSPAAEGMDQPHPGGKPGPGDLDHQPHRGHGPGLPAPPSAAPGLRHPTAPSKTWPACSATPITRAIAGGESAAPQFRFSLGSAPRGNLCGNLCFIDQYP